MSKIAALDVGDVRVGVALSDDEQKHAFPYGVFLRGGGEAERQIIELIQEFSLGVLVVGMPVNEDGTQSEQCAKIERFSRRIARRSSVKLQFIDEYGSTQEAAARLSARGSRVSKDELKSKIDAASASVILEDYLASMENRKEERR